VAIESPASDLLPSDLVAHRYRIERALGAGGMGRVYLVRDGWRDDRPCALKLVRDPALVEAFRATVARAERLHHPGLPEVHGCELDAATGLPFCAMDVCAGVPWPAAWPALGAEERVRAVASLLRALAHVHRHGLVHGDLSPDNVFLATDGPPRASLLDVGGATGPADTVSGTLPYLAPERLAGAPAEARGDLFSLGAVLHESLYGRPAWPDYPRRAPAPDAPPVLAPAAGPAPPDHDRWARFLRPLLALDPAGRPADARAALALLERSFDRAFPPYPADELAAVATRPSFVPVAGDAGRLEAAARDALAGGETAPRIALVGGGAGRGRSRLLDETRRALLRAGVPVVTAAGLSGDAPLALARRLLLRLGAPSVPGAAAAAGDAAGFVGRDTDGERRRLVAAWVDALARTLAERPAVVLVDDLDGADALSRDVLRTLARSLVRRASAGPRSLLVLATDAPTVAADADRSAALRITLRDWTAGEVGRLLLATLPGIEVPERVVRALQRLSGGLPRLLVAQAELLARRGALAVTDDRLRLDEAAAEAAALPATLEDLVSARTAALDPLARRVLRLLALHTAPAATRDLADWLAAGAFAPDGDGAAGAGPVGPGQRPEPREPRAARAAVLSEPMGAEGAARGRAAAGSMPGQRGALPPEEAAAAAHPKTPGRAPAAARAIPGTELGLARGGRRGDAATALPVDPARLETALEALWTAGLAARTEGSAQAGLLYGAPGGAVRSVALAGLDPAAITRAHRVLGARLAAGDPQGERRRAAARHLLLGSPGGVPAAGHRQGAALALPAVRALLDGAAYETAWALAELVLPDVLAPAERRALLRLVGEAATLTGRYDEGLLALDRAVAESEGGSAERSEGLLRAAHLLRRAGRYPEALERLAALFEDAAAAPATLAAGRAEEARVHLMRGEYDGAARAAGDAAAAAADDAEGALVRGHAADVRGLVALYRGAFDEAIPALEEARRLFAAAGQATLVASAASHVGLVHHRRADVESAVDCYRDAMRIAEEAGDRGQTWRFAMNIGVALQERGDPVGALRWYEESLAQAELIDDHGGLLRVSLNLANIHRHLGSLEAAERLLSRTLPLAREAGDRLVEGYALTLLGEVALLRAQYDEAAQRLREALALFQSLGCINEECEVRIDQAWLAIERGLPGQAAAEARVAVDLATRHGLDEFRCRALVARAEAERRRPGGDRNEVVSWLDESRALVGRVGKPELVWWVGYHQFLGLRDRGEAKQALEVGLTALRGLREQAERLPESERGPFLALPPHARAHTELAWLEKLSYAEGPRTGGVWSDASLRRLLEVNKRLAQELDPQRLLEYILDSAILLTGAERGFLLLLPPGAPSDTDALEVVVARNIDHETIRNRRNKVSHGIARQVLQSGESLLTLDAMEDERYRSYLSVHNLRLRSILCVPLRAMGGVAGAADAADGGGEPTAAGPRGMGALYLDNRFRSGAFGEADLAALEAFADQACLALGNARVMEDLRKSREELLASQARVEELNRKLEEELKRTAGALRATEETVQRQRRALKDRHQFANIIGHGAALEKVFAMMERVLDNDVPVLIQGESGTGKELVARAIHYCGARRDAEFVAVNCASIPATLIESELFGHVRGAFTGADRDRRGVFEVAHRGTLLLDEVGDMPPEMQVKLLRALQSGEVQKVGDTRRIRVDVRVLAATNRDLRQLVQDGRFREDLFYRLNVVPILVPPLRDRSEDVPVLVQHFIDENRASGLTQVERARPDVLRLLAAYEWPGNIRELATVVKNGSLFADGTELTVQDLSNFPEILAAGPRSLRRQRDDRRGGVRPLAELEREAIIEALAQFGGNKKKTSEQLGIDRRTLYNKIESYGIVLETSAKVR
jgi:transcriptional regulator with GAF, ATPase, and Fis domain/tetratricopeptide (TPR) repeat protein